MPWSKASCHTNGMYVSALCLSQDMQAWPPFLHAQYLYQYILVLKVVQGRAPATVARWNCTCSRSWQRKNDHAFKSRTCIHLQKRTAQHQGAPAETITRFMICSPWPSACRHPVWIAVEEAPAKGTHKVYNGCAQPVSSHSCINHLASSPAPPPWQSHQLAPAYSGAAPSSPTACYAYTGACLACRQLYMQSNMQAGLPTQAAASRKQQLT